MATTWNGPTRELPVPYNRGQAIVLAGPRAVATAPVRPLLAIVRPVATVARRIRVDRLPWPLLAIVLASAVVLFWLAFLAGLGA